MKFKYSLATAVTLALYKAVAVVAVIAHHLLRPLAVQTVQRGKFMILANRRKRLSTNVKRPASDWTHMTTMPPIQINWALHYTKNSF